MYSTDSFCKRQEYFQNSNIFCMAIFKFNYFSSLCLEPYRLLNGFQARSHLNLIQISDYA